MRELIMSVMLGLICYLLVTHTAMCFAAGRGGISEEAAEDESCD